MNILLISTGGHIGGEETFTRNLAMALITRNYKVWVATGGNVQMSDLMKWNIPIANIYIKGRSLTGLYKGAKRIRTFVRENKIDIVHCQAAGPAIMGGIVKKMHWTFGEKWIYHDHGLKKLTYKWLPVFLNSLDLTITNSDYELIKLKSNRVKDARIVRVHNGIDPNEYGFKDDMKRKHQTEIRKEFGVQTDTYLLGYIGRLSPEKGCDLLISAFTKVLENKSNVRLLIIGDGILRSSLEKKVKFFEISEKVIFTGFRSDIPKILSCLNCLILPSYTETFSLTTIQAMGAGIPVIASDTGGNPEQIISNFNGYLFETGNYLDLSKKILKMINSKKDEYMGNNGKLLVEEYLNENRMVNEIEFYYRKTV